MLLMMLSGESGVMRCKFKPLISCEDQLVAWTISQPGRRSKAQRKCQDFVKG